MLISLHICDRLNEIARVANSKLRKKNTSKIELFNGIKCKTAVNICFCFFALKLTRIVNRKYKQLTMEDETVPH